MRKLCDMNTKGTDRRCSMPRRTIMFYECSGHPFLLSNSILVAESYMFVKS